MLGRRAYKTQTGRRRWLYRVWGSPSIHVRQKWSAVWPLVSDLPQENLEILDLGCGRGDWVLEIAARRPGWKVIGVDRSEDAVATAEAGVGALALDNVRLRVSDFFDYAAQKPFDVVLSVAAIHYAARDGRIDELFDRMRSWVKPGGRLLLLVPRRRARVPFSGRLPQNEWHSVFSAAELQRLCAEHGFSVEMLAGTVGPRRTIAKQFDWLVQTRSPVLRALAYPLIWLLSASERPVFASPQIPTAFWTLSARAL